MNSLNKIIIFNDSSGLIVNTILCKYFIDFIEFTKKISIPEKKLPVSSSEAKPEQEVEPKKSPSRYANS